MRVSVNAGERECGCACECVSVNAHFEQSPRLMRWQQRVVEVAAAARGHSEQLRERRSERGTSAEHERCSSPCSGPAQQRVLSVRAAACAKGPYSSLC